MGEQQPTLFPLDFNRSIRIEDRPERLTGDAGVLALRQIDHQLGLTKWLARHLIDPRNQELITHPFVELLRARLYLMAQGWRDGDDADTKRFDPALRLAVSQRRGIAPLTEPDRDHPANVPFGLASQPTLSRLLRTLSTPANRTPLRHSLLVAAKRHLGSTRKHRPRYATIDIDSYNLKVHGHQPGSAYNGYYHQRCYHPIAAMLALTGDWIDVALRPGNVHTANGAADFVFKVIDAVEGDLCQVADLRGDAGFPDEELLGGLEERGIGYAFRLKDNEVLKRMVEPYLVRPPGRPPTEPRLWLHELSYRAESWSGPRRVVAVIKEVPGELFLDYFFLVTAWSVEQIDAESLLDYYRQRGRFESFIGEFKDALDPALSSSPRVKSHYRGEAPKRCYGTRDAFACNEALLVLYALAYNLTNVGRRGLEQATGFGWTVRSFREHLLKTPARIVLHARRAVVVINDVIAYHWQCLAQFLRGLRPVPT